MSDDNLVYSRNLSFGILPVNLLDRSNLSPMARLCWGVLRSFGETIFPSVAFIAVRMGLDPSSKVAVRRYLDELKRQGFLSVKPRGVAMSNLYTLMMPDYCYIETPDMLQLAPGATGTGPVTRYRGKTAKARQAWLKRREDDKKGGTQEALPGVPASIQGGTQPVPQGVPASIQGGTQPVPHNREGKRELMGGTASPPSAAPGKQNAPLTWKGWPAKYQAAAEKRFHWSKADIQAAHEIDEKLGENIGELELIQKKYLADKFWISKGCPLKKLLENLGEYLPTKSELIAACKHDKYETSIYNNAEGLWTRLRCQACGVCRDTLKEAAISDHDDKLARAWAAMSQEKAAAKAAGKSYDEFIEINRILSELK